MSILTNVMNLFSSNSVYQTLNANNFKDELRKDKQAVILDVRTPAEYKSGHIPGAKNIDIYSSNFADRIKKLNTRKNYYIYCQTGMRSRKACKIMAKHGHENIYNLSRGMTGWHGKTV